MRFGFLVLSFLIWSPLLKAQSDESSLILSHYLKIKEDIAQDKIYQNEFYFSPAARPRPELSAFQRTEKFYFYLSPQEDVLLSLIQVEIDSMDVHYAWEFLVNNSGQLIFAHESQNKPQYHYRELRVFFKDEKLIQLIEDAATIQSSTLFHRHRIHFFQNTAARLSQKFYTYMNFLGPKN